MRRVRSQRNGELLVPFLMFLKNPPLVVIGMIIEGVEPIAVRHRSVLAQCDRAIETGDCFLHVSGLPEDVAQIGIRLGVIGPKPQAGLHRGERFIHAILFVSRPAQVVKSKSILPRRGGALPRRDRFERAGQCLKGVAEIVGCLGITRLEGQRCLKQETACSRTSAR